MVANTILSNEYFDLLFHEEDKVVHHIYKPAMDSEHLYELLTAGTELLRDNGAKKWISDNRELVNTFNQKEADWVNEVWLPETIGVGWKYWAMIVPKDLIANADHIKYVESFYNSGVWVTVWPELDEAFKWITKKDKV